MLGRVFYSYECDKLGKKLERKRCCKVSRRKGSNKSV